MIQKNSHCLSTVYPQFIFVLNRAFIILAVFLFLTNCASPPAKAPISNRDQPPSIKITAHRVNPGETLYSIAWRYGLDYKMLAKANNIGAGYAIFPGQTLSLKNNLNPLPVVPSIYPSTSKKVSPSPLKATPSGASKPVPKQYPKAIGRSEKQSIASVPKTQAIAGTQVLAWRWPVKGRVITNYHSKGIAKKGIDIEGKKGESVNAAASGRVVYAGSGLRGYGKLVIIKHSEVYLSAYAHNDRLRVREGDDVVLGQRIADVGSTGTGVKSEPKLHFQIRRDGKPINPLTLLPKRKS